MFSSLLQIVWLKTECRSYRLNVFGFPGAPGLPDQNLGLLDQRLGTEWLRDNIAKFGGDPKRFILAHISSYSAESILI